jgi:hypothetical protein
VKLRWKAADGDVVPATEPLECLDLARESAAGDQEY